MSPFLSRADGARLAFVGFGGNMEGTEEAISGVLARISKLGEIAAVSGLYETEAQDFKNQANFQNGVLALDLPAAYSPAALLCALLDIELSLGRKREGAIPKGPRVLDLDLLLFGEITGTFPLECSGNGLWSDLVLPHPRMRQRRFVLDPLLEICPDIVEPKSGIPYREYEKAVISQGIYLRRPIQYNRSTV